jgi:hypothetical protein
MKILLKLGIIVLGMGCLHAVHADDINMAKLKMRISGPVNGVMIESCV